MENNLSTSLANDIAAGLKAFEQEEVQSMSHNARNEFIYKKMIEAQE